jgi:autotransporter-associated beta strand protein
MFKFLMNQIAGTPETRRDASVRRGRNRAHRSSAARYQPRLEVLEQRLTPEGYTWFGHAGDHLWSSDRNWSAEEGDGGHAPYGDPSAVLGFIGFGPLDTIHDFTGPTTIQSIAFSDHGYSLSAGPGASVITLTGDISSALNAGTSTINLPLYFSAALHEFNVGGSDTIVLSGSGNLSGPGLIHKIGTGTLVMSGDHTTFQGQIEVSAGSLLVGSDNGVGNNEPITVDQGGVLDLNNHNETLNMGISTGEIQLGSGNLTLPGSSTFTGDINGTGGLILSGNADVTLDGRQNYTGQTRLLSGYLFINGSSAASPITISPGAHLHGQGTTGPLTVRGSVGPGDGQLSVAVLHSNGDVNFLAESSFDADIHGLNPGDGGVDGYDQLNVIGRVDLSGSPTLHASVTFNSHPGDSFSILTSTDGITGTFAGLPDGTNIVLNGTPMQIHYTANSVVLTHRPQFAPPVPYAAGRGPIVVATGDFRGNGIKDLVTANNDASVNVLLGNGNGTFQAAVNYPVAHTPSTLTVGDFNGDGMLDLLTTSFDYGIPTMSVLLGNGDGTFQDAVTSPMGDRQAWAVAAGDFRGNGILDLVTTNYYEQTVSVLLGNGDGSFQPAVPYPLGRFPGAVLVANLGNGTLDIVTANSVSVSVLVGNGDGTFQPARDMPVTYGGFTSIAVGDFRGNGKLDLIGTANSAFDSAVYVLLSNGDGTFADPRRVLVTDQPGNVAVGDFDGDGKLDFVVTTGYPSGRGLALVYGRGDGTFFEPSYYFPGQGFSSLVADSFQGTRFPDLAVVNPDPSTGTNVVSVLLNVGDGSPPPTPPPGGSGGHAGTSPVAALFPGDDFPRSVGADAALGALPGSPGNPTSLSRLPRAMTPVPEVAGVERFFAIATVQDLDSAWLRLRSSGEARLGADDAWWTGIWQEHWPVNGEELLGTDKK